MIDFILKTNSTVVILLYILFCTIVIWIAKFITKKDATIDLEVPEPTSISAIDTALLSKGIKGVIITCIISLWSKKVIDISKRGKSTFIRKIDNQYNGINDAELVILNYLKTPKLYRHFFNENAILKIEKILQPNIWKLRELKLVTSQKITFKSKILFVLTTLFILIPVSLLFYFEIVKDQTVIVLVIGMLLAELVLLFITKPAKIQKTALGQKFIKHSSQRFEWLKTERNTNILMANNNVSYLVALFGASAFLENISSDYNAKEIATTLDYGCGGGGMNGENCSNAGGCAGGGCSINQ